MMQSFPDAIRTAGGALSLKAELLPFRDVNAWILLCDMQSHSGIARLRRSQPFYSQAHTIHFSASKTGAPSQCSMGDRRLEWSRCLDGGPCAWTAFNPGTTCHDNQDAPGWFMPAFHIVDQEFLKCRFLTWCADKPAVAVYAAQELRYCGFWVGYPAGEVYVREVPPPLVVTCSLNPIDDNGSEAVFTTVAGSVMLRLNRVDHYESTLKGLAQIVAMAAAAQDRVQSRNREVCVILEGQRRQESTVTVPEFFWAKLGPCHPQRK